MSSVIAVHLGAGVHSHRFLKNYDKLCTQALTKGISELNKGESIMNAVAEATCVLEDSPLTNAGIGSNLTFDGTVECDASVMDGETFACGSVSALTCTRNPVKVALALAERSNKRLSLGRVPPCVMTGEGAKKWTREGGSQLDDFPEESLVTEQSKRMHTKSMRKLSRLSTEHERREQRTQKNETENSDVNLHDETYQRLDTVGCVGANSFGWAAASCSSGGVLLKQPGRIGQAGIFGAGCWAEGTLAISVSGTGEDLIRTGLCREVARVIHDADDLVSCLTDVITDKFLKSRLLPSETIRLCGILVLRSETDGHGELVWAHTTPTMVISFLSSAHNKPKFQISRLPDETQPGTKVLVGGLRW